MNVWILSLLTLLQFGYASILQSLGPPKLLLISMDGFRYDYLNTDRIPADDVKNFYEFVKNGVKAEYMESVFPTVTYPNHYTLITGLYPESHGIVHNRFYDGKLKRQFLYDDISDNIDPLWYDLGPEPIYVTNQNADKNRRSGSIVWPTGIGKVKCVGPSKVLPNFLNAFANMTIKERIDTIISWFNASKDPINLGLLYIPEPDEIAHKYGPNSQQVKDYIKKDLNDALGYLFSELKKNDLWEHMNIILTADHGFAEVNKFVALDDYIDSAWYTTGSEKNNNFANHVTVQIFPTPGNDERVYEALQKVSDIYIFKKGGRELIDLHYSNNDRIAPIIITGNEGVIILKNMSEAPTFPEKGMHGYRPDIPDMRPFFMAMGPAFKKGYLARPFKNVDVYPLMCHILGINPAPNNGSLENVLDMLAPNSFTEMSLFTVTAVTFVMVVGTSVMVAGIFAICACINARKAPRLLRANNRNRGGQTAHHLLESEDDDEF